MYFESQRKKHTILTERLHTQTHRYTGFVAILGLGRRRRQTHITDSRENIITNMRNEKFASVSHTSVQVV